MTETRKKAAEIVAKMKRVFTFDDIENAIEAALVAAGEEATKVERERCCKAACQGCRLNAPTYIENGDQVWHELIRSNRHSMDAPCQSACLNPKPTAPRGEG